MNRILVVALGAAALLAGAAVGGLSTDATAPTPEVPAAPAPPVGATLLEGLGNHHFPVTSKHPEVQRWFNQALMLTFGFNHDAAERSYLKAAQLDPDCAMCWWGAALVLGPHVNSGMDPARNADAWTRMQRAVALAPRTTEREQAFIRALVARYAEQPPQDRRPLDEAFAQSTRQLMQDRPDDLDAAVLHAEALMDLQPWDYYDAELRPKGNTAEIVSILESVMARNPDHAGALHLYVHAVEASADPQRGVAAADRLRELIPGAGHLVHMPAHIYSRVGRWHDAVIANQRAIAADDAYLSSCRGNINGLYPLGYVPHNHHFLWFAASMGGTSKVARDAALQTAARVNLPELMRQPGFAGLQHYWMTPWFDRVRFARWSEIDGQPNPAPDLPYVTAIWNYARAMADVRQDRIDDAVARHASLVTAAADPLFEEMTVWDRYPLAHAVRIAERTVAAEIALARDDPATAIAALREAVTIEDGIPYDEPPGWHAPVRQTLGVALLVAGQPAEAEAVYREELRRNPGNGWSLRGLADSLAAQKRRDEARAAQQQFAAAWAHADVKLGQSRL